MCRVFAEVCNVCSTPCIQGKAILFTCLDIHTIQMFQESVEPELQDGMQAVYQIHPTYRLGDLK